MHELGVICRVIETVNDICEKENIPTVTLITLEIGELSGIVPLYIENCFPAVTYNKERFKDTKLEIEVVPGLAKCKSCGEVFNVVKHEGYCPKCESFDKDVISGLDFLVKDIVVPEE